ncbi:MAG: hypothetical protein KY464_02300 [Gemmatimonadetes bacterium]|nr:hypothetical protein [Gemmatimonadota bacterium]
MHRFARYRRVAALLLSIGGALTFPTYGHAQERHAAWTDPGAGSSPALLAPAAAGARPAPVVLEISPPRPTSAVRRAFLSNTGRAGMYIGLALGAQIGAVQALTSCQRRREGHCLENHLPSEVAFTVGGGAIGAVVGTLISRRREPAANEGDWATPAPAVQ